MPRRTDIHTILIIGSGPIVIGQGPEFDYSGVQACRALREEGYRVVLVNSNPATIMTDPEFADATYVEPITPETVEKILQREKENGTPVDALLPTLGGQTGLNTGMACFDQGILQKYAVTMIGADREAIHRGEDRQRFKELMGEIGLKVPTSRVVHNMADARQALEIVGLPAIIRPAFTLGGTGGGIAYNVEEFEEIVQRGLDASPVTEVLIEQSVIGWKEYEMEVVRDKNDNCIIVCSIENIDAMGVHTGDSITVAPIQTLTDKEYQKMRDASFAVIRAVGVETGGSNIQFGINPKNGDMVVIEMNPRVSRSSALASKATGYPIAKIAAKLAVGYTLDELPNPITSRKRGGRGSNVSSTGSKNTSTQSTATHKTAPDGSSAENKEDWELYTSACFEPSIDYCVIKIPRWTFEKFPDADETLTTQMKSVGEAMAIGRTFKEALQKGIRSMEVKRYGFGLDASDKWLAAQQSDDEAKRGVGVPPTAERGRDAHATNWPIPDETLRRKLAVPSQGRLYYVRYALKMGWTVEQIHGLTHIDPWFLAQMKELTDFESELQSKGDFASLDSQYVRGTLQKAKALGYSDVQLSSIWNVDPKRLRQYRKQLGASCVYKLVDTCAAEFEAATPYYYSTYEMPFSVVGATLASPATSPASESGRARQASPLQDAGTTMVAEDEIRLTDKPKVIIIGGGPNRIGQGIEFDYCCVQAAFAMRELGLESVMINSNPETVSTDYDTSDLLFFEPLTHEDVLNVCERLNGKPFGAPRDAQAHGSAVGIEGARPTGLVKGVIVQFGGQTPLNLARGLHDAGVPIIGTSIDMLEAAGDREKFRTLVEQVGLKQPANGIARSVDDARKIAAEIGYPVLVRPSFVLGGRAMEIVSDEAQLNHYMAIAVKAEGSNPILVDKFLDHATECDVDCIADYDPLGNGRSVICGVMEHIEEAGIHSGDSACALPPYSFTPEIIRQLKDHTHKLASVLKVRGLMNVQYAIKDGEIYLIEVNPRASRTIPFVGKATGVPWALLAAKVMAGESLDKLGVHEIADPKHVSVKEVVFPFSKFPGVDVILGPEMRSTGEVMGIDDDFAGAYAKAQMAAGAALPLAGTVFISVNDRDKPEIADVARLYADAGFKILATGGTYDVLAAAGVKSERISKLAEGRPNVRDAIKNGQLQLIINTPTKKGPATDEGKIRAMSVMNKVPIVTTVTAARAAGKAIGKLQKNGWSVKPLQAYHAAKSD